jgi:hypothetical protein
MARAKPILFITIESIILLLLKITLHAKKALNRQSRTLGKFAPILKMILIWENFLT